MGAKREGNGRGWNGRGGKGRKKREWKWMEWYGRKKREGGEGRKGYPRTLSLALSLTLDGLVTGQILYSLAI